MISGDSCAGSDDGLDDGKWAGMGMIETLNGGTGKMGRNSQSDDRGDSGDEIDNKHRGRLELARLDFWLHDFGWALL